MSAPLDSVTVNAAFLQEIKEAHEELWVTLDSLRRACSHPLISRTPAAEFFELVNRLRDQLALQFALEESFGYFEGAVNAAPHLSEFAVKLRSEHETLYAEVCRIAEAVEATPDRDDAVILASHAAPLFHAFDQRLKTHEANENDLIARSLSEDLRGGD